MVFIESAAFSRRLRALTGIDESSALRGIQNDLIELPSRGDLVPDLAESEKHALQIVAAEKANVEVFDTFIFISSIDNIFTS